MSIVQPYYNREVTKVQAPKGASSQAGSGPLYQSLKVMHWNILAQRLTKDFGAIDPRVLTWSHRSKLIKQHIKEMDPDVLGISEFDCIETDLPADYNRADFDLTSPVAAKDLLKFLTMEMDYDFQLVEKANGLSASAVFFKSKKFKCLNKGYIDLDTKPMARAMVYCHLEEVNSSLKFLFAEAHLKAMPGQVNEVHRFK